ncbi:MAG: GNAT family N-acetyltransferase [Thermonemataceae bacterium]
MNASIEKATLEDLPTLNKISVAAKSYWNYPQEWIDYWKREANLLLQPEDFTQQVIYKLITEEIIGFGSIEKHADHYEFIHLWIAPAYIGQGYGRFLLESILAAVVEPSAVVILEADPNAEAFYQKLGFTTYDQVESYPAGRYLPVMKRVY